MEVYVLSYGWAFWSACSHPWASPFCSLKLWVLKGRVYMCFRVCALCRKVHEGVLGHLWGRRGSSLSYSSPFPPRTQQNRRGAMKPLEQVPVHDTSGSKCTRKGQWQQHCFLSDRDQDYSGLCGSVIHTSSSLGALTPRAMAIFIRSDGNSLIMGDISSS